jgi:hypothetical protein
MQKLKSGRLGLSFSRLWRLVMASNPTTEHSLTSRTSNGLPKPLSPIDSINLMLSISRLELLVGILV